MCQSIFFDHGLWVAPTVESASEHLTKLFVKTADTQILKVEISLEELFLFCCPADNLDLCLVGISRVAPNVRLLHHVAVSEVVGRQTLNLGHCDLHYHVALPHHDRSLLLKVYYLAIVGGHHSIGDLIALHLANVAGDTCRVSLDQLNLKVYLAQGVLVQVLSLADWYGIRVNF